MRTPSDTTEGPPPQDKPPGGLNAAFARLRTTLPTMPQATQDALREHAREHQRDLDHYRALEPADRRRFGRLTPAQARTTPAFIAATAPVAIAARRRAVSRTHATGRVRRVAPRPRARRARHVTRSTSSSDPGGSEPPGEPPPPRLTLARPPAARYTFGCIPAEARS